MPLGNDSRECLVYLGKALKGKRRSGEQFCVFSFDCMEHDSLEPSPGETDRADLPFSTDLQAGQPVPNWNAAFYADTAPAHTERAILEDFGQWISDYDGTYGAPRTLYIYSLLIPCLRDGSHGHCADNIFAWVLWANQNYGIEDVHVGWSNDDRDLDLAAAIKTLLADLEDEGAKRINISLHKVSIA